MYRRLFGTSQKKPETLLKIPLSTLDEVKLEINKHRIWCDEVIALLTNFMSTPGYYTNMIGIHFRQDTQYGECFKQIKKLDDELQGRVLERKLTANKLKKQKKELSKSKELLETPDAWKMLKNELKKVEDQSSIEASEIAKLGTFDSFIKEYNGSIVNIPDIIFSRFAQHYASATSNRNAAGILANYSLKSIEEKLICKTERSLEENYLLKLLTIYQLINQCAAFGQKVDCNTESLATPIDAKLKSKGLPPSIKEEVKSKDEFFEYIKLYIHNSAYCLGLIERFINVELQSLINLKPRIDLCERTDIRISMILSNTRKNLEKIKDLVKQDPDLWQYCSKDEDIIEYSAKRSEPDPLPYGVINSQNGDVKVFRPS